MDFMYDFKQAQMDRLEDAGVNIYSGSDTPKTRGGWFNGLTNTVKHLVTTALFVLGR